MGRRISERRASGCFLPNMRREFVEWQERTEMVGQQQGKEATPNVELTGMGAESVEFEMLERLELGCC